MKFNLNIGARNGYIKKLAYNIDFQGHMYIKVFAQQPNRLKIWLSRLTPLGPLYTLERTPYLPMAYR